MPKPMLKRQIKYLWHIVINMYQYKNQKNIPVVTESWQQSYYPPEK